GAGNGEGTLASALAGNTRRGRIELSAILGGRQDAAGSGPRRGGAAVGRGDRHGIGGAGLAGARGLRFGSCPRGRHACAGDGGGESGPYLIRWPWRDRTSR